MLQESSRKIQSSERARTCQSQDVHDRDDDTVSDVMRWLAMKSVIDVVGNMDMPARLNINFYHLLMDAQATLPAGQRLDVQVRPRVDRARVAPCTVRVP
eukprot:1664884-Prymnesium_polylepis.1